MSHPSFELAVVMERRLLDNPWQPVQWAAVELRNGEHGATAPRMLDEDARRARWLHTGFKVDLYTDEAEGYFLNLSAEQPFLFVMWRMDKEVAVPQVVTASYNEASRMLDAGESVDGLPMPDEIRIATSSFMLKHYRPESKKQRARPPSFEGAQRDE